MAGIGGVMSALGSFVSAAGTLAAGQARQKAAQFEAARDEVRAGEAKAIAQRDAEKLARERRLALSRLQAMQAASGFSGGDPTALRLRAAGDREGRYREGLARYGGDTRAADLRNSAAASRMSGEAAMQDARFGATRSIISGVSSLFRRYG